MDKMQLAPIDDRRLVRIVWLDHYLSDETSGWKRFEDVPTIDEALRCETVGWIIGVSNGAYLVASTMNEDQYDSSLVIMKCAIVSIHNLLDGEAIK